MKVTLDLGRLLADGVISPEEHDRLARLGRRDTGLLLINLLIGFGVLAVSGAAVVLIPDAVTGLVLGAVLMAAGAGLTLSRRPQWAPLATICVLLAALMLGAGVLLISQGLTVLGPAGDHGPWLSIGTSCLLVAALFAATAVLARSALLAALTVLMLFAALGGSGSYGFAEYILQVRQPLLTVLVFSILALAAHLASYRLRADWERLTVVVARTALLLVNFGFWIGSLWGDRDSILGTVPPVAFGVAWAVALLGAAIWAGWANRRWVLTLAAVFGGIHFYTQWFEHLGATPGSVLAAGLLTLVFAVLVQRLHKSLPGASKPA